jgi:hypothetical protein
VKFGLKEPECGDCHSGTDAQEDHEQAVTLIFLRRVSSGLPTHHDGDHPYEDEYHRQQEEETAHAGMVYRMRLALNIADTFQENRGEDA